MSDFTRQKQGNRENVGNLRYVAVIQGYPQGSLFRKKGVFRSPGECGYPELQICIVFLFGQRE